MRGAAHFAQDDKLWVQGFDRGFAAGFAFEKIGPGAGGTVLAGRGRSRLIFPFPRGDKRGTKEVFGLKHFHSSCRVGFVVFHPFHREREKDGARSFLAPSVKML